MGYCYGRAPSGRYALACDNCGAVGGVRKRKCPHGYCPSAALCAGCSKSVKASGKWTTMHACCEAAHAAFVAKEKAGAALLAAGKLLRCSALNVSRDGSKVHVLFKDKDGAYTGYYVTKETYDAIPLGTHATPEDYAAVGTLTPAPGDFNYKAYPYTDTEVC